MAGNHSEILSKEPECWPEAAEPGRLRDPSDLPGLAAHPRRPGQRPRQRCSRCPSASLLSRKSGSEEQQPAGLCPGAHSIVCLSPHPAPKGESGALPSPPPVPSGSGKVLLFIRRSSRSRGFVFSCVLPSFFSAPGPVCAPVPEPSTSPGALRHSPSLGQQDSEPGLPRVSRLAQRFPAQLISPQGHLAATWCHLCVQTARPHGCRAILDTRGMSITHTTGAGSSLS